MVKEFIHKGRTIKVDPNVRTRKIILNGLNNTQRMHIEGKINVYEPIEAYEERWETETTKDGYWEWFKSARPIPGTRRRADLPPLFMQWKDAARKFV